MDHAEFLLPQLGYSSKFRSQREMSFPPRLCWPPSIRICDRVMRCHWSRMIRAILLIMFVTLPACAVSSKSLPGGMNRKRDSAENVVQYAKKPWSTPRRGMSQQQVLDLMGEPDSMTTSGGGETWYYRQPEGDHGMVAFQKGRVVSWAEPSSYSRKRRRKMDVPKTR